MGQGPGISSTLGSATGAVLGAGHTHGSRKSYWRVCGRLCTTHLNRWVRPPNAESQTSNQEIVMKIWNKPQVREQAVGMEVTAYLPADIDLI